MEALTQRRLSLSISRIFSFVTLEWLLLILSGAIAFFLAIEAARFLPVHSDNAYPEASGIVSAYRMSQGLGLYSDYRQPPFVITPFPPFWYALLAGGAKLASLDLAALTLYGRVLTLLGLFSMLGLVYLWNRRAGFSWQKCTLAVTCYLAFPVLVPWIFTARPDFVALSLGFLALYLISVATSTPLTAAAAISAGLAFLTRHNAIAVPLTIVLWLVFTQRWRVAVLFSSVWWLLVGVVVLLFERSSHGLLALNLSGASFGQFALSYARDIAERLLMQPGHGFAVLLFTLGLLGFIETFRRTDQRFRLIAIYFLVSFVLALIGSSARGAAVNHYFEPALACAALLPIGMSSLQESWNARSAMAPFAILFVCVLLLPTLDMQRSYFEQNKPENLSLLVSIIQGKEIFTDVSYLAARSRNLELLEPASLMNSERAKKGNAWSSADIVRDLEDQKYKLIILSSPADVPYDPSALYPRYPHLDSAVRNAIRSHYGLCFQIEGSEIFGQTETRYIYEPLSNKRDTTAKECPILPNLNPNDTTLANAAARQN